MESHCMIILASASPRRQELLRNAGIPFAVYPADINEAPFAGESPRDCAVRLAREKAVAVFQDRPQNYVLAADTIVVVDDAILGKPRDKDDAARMLRLLAGRTHAVITGVCLVSPISIGQRSVASDAEQLRTENQELSTASETTLVTMRQLSDNEISEYVATGEPMDKAGAYAIQGIASRWIPRIEGDYCNVVGVPVALVYAMLRKARAV
ncbi:MAG: Maf family protein [Candidatus Sulfotelmatobacter sp.]